MLWTGFFVLSVTILIISLVVALTFNNKNNKSSSDFTPLKIIFVGVIFSTVFLFLPIYIRVFETTECGIFEAVMISFHNMIRLFVVDGDFEFITDNINGLTPLLSRLYTVLFSILFVLAPILTFGFVMSFFKNVSAHLQFICNYKKDICAFSELNEKSITLANDIKKSHPKMLFVFCDVFSKEEEQIYELIEKSKSIGAINFKRDIVTLNFNRHSKKSKISLFAIGENENENVSQALKIIENYKYRKNTNLYVFSTQIETELLLVNAFKNTDGEKDAEIKVRRINEVQSLVSRMMYDSAYSDIFCSAKCENGVKKISAVVLGMGEYGTEMTKTLAWLCQMDGYEIEINSYDMNSDAEEKFVSTCSELMSPIYNGKTGDDEDACYKIKIHSGVDINTSSFDSSVCDLGQVTYVFISLGNDEKNISTAVKIRSLLKRKGMYPVIKAICKDTEKKEALSKATNFRNQQFDIQFVGDVKSFYSEKVIINSDLEKIALKRHIKWGNENDFWQYNYNYKSSISSAIHSNLKVKCGVPGADKKPNERTEEERNKIRKLEHRRWSAYMRSEGYCYGKEKDDIAKTHNCMVPFSDLPLKEQVKDDN